MIPLDSQPKQGTDHLSEFEKESIELYQVLQRCQRDPRTLHSIILSLAAIGTKKPSLVIQSVSLLSSSNFIGNLNISTARISAIGLETLIKVPDLAAYLKYEKEAYLSKLLEERSQIVAREWQDYCQTLRHILNLLGQNVEPPREIFLCPNTPYDSWQYLKDIVMEAKCNLKIIDPYANHQVVSLIRYCNLGVNIQILSQEKPGEVNNLILEEAKRYKKQYEHIEVKMKPKPKSDTGELHERFIIIDDDKIYRLGGSISGCGGKSGIMVGQVWTPQGKQSLIDYFITEWRSAIQKV